MQTDPLFLHIRVVMGIILGLSITTVLKGLAQIIEHPQRRGCSALHLGWVAWTLISLVTFWWWEFRLIEVHRWTFETYLFVIVYCATWFLLCALLFPDDLREYGSYGNYLMQRRRWIFSVIAALTLLDLRYRHQGQQPLEAAGSRVPVACRVDAGGGGARLATAQPTHTAAPGAGNAGVPDRLFRRGILHRRQ